MLTYDERKACNAGIEKNGGGAGSEIFWANIQFNVACIIVLVTRRINTEKFGPAYYSHVEQTPSKRRTKYGRLKAKSTRLDVKTNGNNHDNIILFYYFYF